MLGSIEIKNFKSIEQTLLTLAPLTILTGANSSGKSSVMQSLMLIIKYSSDANWYSMEDLLRYTDDFSAIRNKKVNAKVIEISVNIENIENIEKHTIYINDEDVVVSSQLNYEYEPRNKNNNPELFYLNANRIGAQDIVVNSKHKVGTSGEFIFSTFDKIKSKALDDSLIHFEDSKTLSYQTGKWLSYITDTKTELVTEKTGDNVEVSFQVEDLGVNISPYNLGAGISYVSKVLIICLMAKKGDLVLLENPEVQLHPKSQAKLGVFLAFIASKGIQLVIETHCEHLINRIRVEVHKEKIEGGDVVVHYKPSTDDDFQTLHLDEYGHFIDSNEKRKGFPKGFFDASVDALLSLR